MESKAIINIVHRHRVITEARQSVGKVLISPETETHVCLEVSDIWIDTNERLGRAYQTG